MRRRLRPCLARGASVAALAAGIAAVYVSSATAAGPLRTGVVDPVHFASSSERDRSFDRVRAAGGTIVRLVLNWNAVAPATRPPGFDASNPSDPAYSWSAFDAQVRAAAQRGLDPIVTIVFAPRWATRSAGSSTYRPDPAALAAFAEAAARRYSGVGAFPRVRYWQVWNEPNRDHFLTPQYAAGRMASARMYRAMVEGMAAGVHRADSSNRVVAGGLAPLGRARNPAPLAFMREMLCVSRALARTCDLRANPIDLDIWSHHPYTSGGPLHRANGRDDVALGDLPEMRRVLRAAVRAGHIRSRGSGVGFWVTEFSWDSNPPDPQALRASLHQRWVAEALYRMWQNGVTAVVWWRVQDDPLRGAGATPYQSGFWTTGGRVKRSVVAFRFPVVALRRSRGVYVWGRTPAGRPGAAAIEIRTGRSWRRLGTVRTNGHGIFSRTFPTAIRRGSVRARLVGTRAASLPFSLRYVGDRYVNPFGCGGSITC